MKRARATKRTMELMARVACDKEGDGNGYKSDGDEGDGQVMATRVLVMAKANNNQPATGATKVGGGWQESVDEVITQSQWWVTTNDESVRQMMMAVTKRARVERAMVTAMRVAGKEEGKGNEEEDGVSTRVVCDEEGDGDGCKSNGNKGDGQASATNQHKEEGECAASEAARIVLARCPD
jgi:hypothetical protein